MRWKEGDNTIPYPETAYTLCFRRHNIVPKIVSKKAMPSGRVQICFLSCGKHIEFYIYMVQPIRSVFLTMR